MKKSLYQYDVYPKVFLVSNDTVVNICPQNEKALFLSEHEYVVKIHKFSESNPCYYPERDCGLYMHVKADCKGCLSLDIRLNSEGEYLILVYANEDDKKEIASFNIFAVDEDMKGRIPLRGDLHIHTCRSDGRESPNIVSANYRGSGYDFFTISDHGRYYPSLEAMRFYDGITDFCIVPGEEVHLPYCNPHYVNFGGSFSINALLTPNKNQEHSEDDPSWRSLDGACPETMSVEEFKEMIEIEAQNIPLKHETERRSFAVLKWIYKKIQKGDGLGIFPHPYWRHPLDHIPDEYLEYIYREMPFDAFEVLGGESFYSHNGFQTAFYYDMKCRGIDPPIVGSTDSHSSISEHNPNALICSTIVFAHENTREELISSIKDKYSVAVDTISREYRLVGELRLIKYASFLLEEYYPIHDLACRSEGYYMLKYAQGDKDALNVLKAMKGQVPKLIKKYINV